MDDWSDLKEWADSIMEEQVKEEQREAVSIFMHAVTRPTTNEKGELGKTPVLSGRLMANTIVSIDRVDNSFSDEKDLSGDKTRQEGIAKAATAPAYSKIYIQNNTQEKGSKYHRNADYLGWLNNTGEISTPAYKFFTMSEQTLLAEMKDRN